MISNTSFFRLLASGLLLFSLTASYAQSDNYTSVKTFVNPVLPGDHPDPTLIKAGDDFYHCGSSFHFTPYLPVYHSKDLVHWEVISRVVPPSKAAWVGDKPGAGIWQGAITHFYGSWWVYFSSNGQWFCKAPSPEGPWSDPVQVSTNPVTGSLGYDNSIFVDDEGTPYMVIKNGQKVNRLQRLGRDGQLTDTVINLDWINAHLQYSWAEGPVMCKRNGYYYYFPAGDVSGGQYVLRASTLTADSAKWERLGNFFKPTTDTALAFKIPNHIAAPLQLADGSWWTLGQSYERTDTDDWSGMGRQTSLYPVIWEGDRPWGIAPTSKPLQMPALPKSAIPWRSVTSDYFNTTQLPFCWHFLNRKAAAAYSLTNVRGWLQLTPDSSDAHILQKETDHYYTAITRVAPQTGAGAAKAGIFLTNGNQHVTAKLSYNGDDRNITLQFDTAVRTVPNPYGDTLWLKLERNLHELTGWYSADGKQWFRVGVPVNVAALDKVQPDFNSWVGTSLGLFASGRPAAFDCFIYKDAFSALPAAGSSNYFGVKRNVVGASKSITPDSENGGWCMIAGVDFGNGERVAKSIELQAAAQKQGPVEVWLDDIGSGQLLATVQVPATGSFKPIKANIKKVTGQHDVFIRFPKGKQQISLHNIRFL
ncbi:family 43 glycosylhydrolase [Chitinophaga sp. Cy-1792]|uniref:family 43 glycosylhydrolase n=1 Tax=Chitinophaga sp. Cy-1792 TaxID=2608339 RepID=UPI00142067CB|nr:family 43 glycosylhydrolase [Chitinophaga sp. Cy-1792]NIG55036.1 family 43 glycosylhydrolase [Chitinophaga sp. Cy-1792]